MRINKSCGGCSDSGGSIPGIFPELSPSPEDRFVMRPTNKGLQHQQHLWCISSEQGSESISRRRAQSRRVLFPGLGDPGLGERARRDLKADVCSCSAASNKEGWGARKITFARADNFSRCFSNVHYEMARGPDHCSCPQDQQRLYTFPEFSTPFVSAQSGSFALRNQLATLKFCNFTP